jgi:hypothetical protein
VFITLFCISDIHEMNKRNQTGGGIGTNPVDGGGGGGAQEGGGGGIGANLKYEC